MARTPTPPKYLILGAFNLTRHDTFSSGDKRNHSRYALLQMQMHIVSAVNWLQGLTGVGVCEQRADRQEHFADCERRAPLVLQDVQADLAIAVDVAVVDARAEDHLKIASQEVTGTPKTVGCSYLQYYLRMRMRKNTS